MALDNTGELDAADDARSGDGSDGGNDAGQMERNGAGMVQMEWDGADAGADMGGDDAAGADVKRLTEQIIALNAQHGKRKGVPNRARTITTDALAAAVAEVQSGRQGLRSAGQCVEEAATVPNEHAGLRGVDEVVRNTTCRCACCGYTCAFGLQLGRAQTFELGQTSMWGASNFQEHPVAKMLVLSATLLEEFGWSELVIPFCDRDFLDDALLDSGQRAPAAALQSWHDAKLDLTAQAAKAAAVELPFVEAAPTIPVDFATGMGHIEGVHLAIICVDRAHVLAGSAALRALWAHELSPNVIKNYEPIDLSEETMLRIVANATIYGNRRMATATGEEQAALWMSEKDAAVAVFQMDSSTLDTVRAASCTADVDAMRACLRRSAVSHVLAPQGATLDRSAETVARSSEAAAFMRDPSEMAQQSFCRPGAAAGMFDGASAAKRLAQHADVRERVAREHREHITFIAPSNTHGGLRSLAMRYIADEAGRARKRKGKGGEPSTRMAGDGANQPRYVRIYPPVRGAELDGEALKQLSVDEAYMQDVRKPQQAMTGRILLTLQHYGYGMEALSADQVTNPFETSAVTWLRVCNEQPDFDAACHYFASGTRASLVLQPMAVHVDGVAQRKQRHRTSVELLTTRWADAAHSWTDSERAAELAMARGNQPHVGKSLWLRSSISLDVRPCRGLALVAVRAAGLIPPPVRNIRLPFEPPSLVHRALSQSTASPHPSRIVWAATRNGVASRGPLRSRVDLMIVSTTSHSTRCAGGREGALGSYRWWVGPSRWPAGEEVRRDSRRGPMPGAALRAHLFRGAAPQVNNPRPANGWAATRQNRRTGVMY